MSRPVAPILVRVAVVVLVLAVVLCLVVPMTGAGDQTMQFALACCFILAVALGVFLLRRVETLLLGDTGGHPVPPARRSTRTARAPDIVALGSLLI